MQDDDEAHKREQDELRRKRKAAKMSKSETQQEKERRRNEYRQKILQGQGGTAATSGKSSRTSDEKEEIAKFQKLFEQRAQGFQIEFRFRNAPPRPPVGPCFVGQTIEAVLVEQSKQYKTLNAVEVHHRWQLHSEQDFGVPLAPSAMDPRSYDGAATSKDNENLPALEQPDLDLLDWKGSMGDTAAEKLKLRQDRARAAARAILTGQTATMPPKKVASATAAATGRPAKKAFSRLLDEQMPVFMKKTTYLSNDYSRKVHDFKSLAQTKQEVAQDLQVKQEEIAKGRSKPAILASFEHDQSTPLVHPTRKHAKPKTVFSVLPHVHEWGKAYTHVIIDKPPPTAAAGFKGDEMAQLERAVVANVDHQQSRLVAQLLVPTDDDEAATLQSTSTYDLDVIPLRAEDEAPVHYCFWLDRQTLTARYVPLSSRVQLSTSRPPQTTHPRTVARRDDTATEQREWEKRQAEVDVDMADKHHIDPVAATLAPPATTMAPDVSAAAAINIVKTEDNMVKFHESDDDEDEDFGDDDDSSEDQVFSGRRKTIVADAGT